MVFSCFVFSSVGGLPNGYEISRHGEAERGQQEGENDRHPGRTRRKVSVQ
jgi:hypothetical protein